MIFQTLTLFFDNSTYSFHPIGLKYAGKLDYEILRRFQYIKAWYSYRSLKTVQA